MPRNCKKASITYDLYEGINNKIKQQNVKNKKWKILNRNKITSRKNEN